MARHTAPDPASLDKWTTFTRNIFRDADADPGYYALMYADLPEDQKARVAVAWCAYYNLGIAARASEYKGAKFYKYLRDQYATAKRASERRHFRGRAGTEALEMWEAEFPKPEQMVSRITRGNADDSPLTYAQVRARTDKVRMMGPYFAWKWCDLCEVLSGEPVDFRGSEKFSPKVPQEGAKLLFPDKTIAEAYAEIVRFAVFKGVTTLTGPDRAFGIQEAETVCCVYKQYRSGSYVYGSRTAKAIARLDSIESDTGATMAQALLDQSPWQRDQLADILATM